MSKTYKIGETVTTSLLKSTMKKVKVVGKIKSIKKEFGRDTYVIENGMVEEFSTRTIK